MSAPVASSASAARARPRRRPAQAASAGSRVESIAGSIGGVRLGESNDIVESAAAQERRLDPLGPVGGGQQDHAFDVAQVVDLAQQLAQDALVDVRVEMVGADVRGATASMVSKNSRHGADRRAFLKTSRSAFSDSPSHFE